MKKIQLFFLFCVLISCNKTNVNKQLTTSELLSGTKSKSWIGSNANVSLPGLNTNIDLFSVLPTCETDDVMIIFPSKTVENREGLTKCDSKGSDTKNLSKWTLSSDEKSIIVENFVITISPNEKLSFANQELKILDLTVTTLKLEAKIKYRNQDAIILASFIAK